MRLRRRGDDDRADLVQRGGKGPVDEVVVGSGAGQQNGGDTAQIDRHHTIVPGRQIPAAAARPRRGIIGTNRVNVAMVG